MEIIEITKTLQKVAGELQFYRNNLFEFFSTLTPTNVTYDTTK
jgi:hypothetical protein